MHLAGGQGSRLKVLTEKTAKPAVPFGGKYRIIDFTLSNCRNSGISTVGILTQYQPLELNWYIGNGSSWDLDSERGGAFILPPYMNDKDSSNWYQGTADAIFQTKKSILSRTFSIPPTVLSCWTHVVSAENYFNITMTGSLTKSTSYTPTIIKTKPNVK